MSAKEYKTSPSARNKFLVESYQLTSIRTDIGIYGQRLLLRLVEAANATGVVEGLSFKNGDCRQISPARVDSDLFGHTVISMPMTAIMGDSWEHSKVTKDIRGCMSHIITAQDEDGNTVMFPFLTYAKFNKGMLQIEVRDELWNTFLDFSKGFRKFELQAALQFKSAYALRFYKLVAGQVNNLTYSIADLKKMLGLINDKGKEKYPLAKDFIRRVVDPAKAELDSCSPYTFSYELLTSRKVNTGRAAITAITLRPVYQPKFRDENLYSNELVQKYPGAFGDFGLSQGVKNVLMHKFGLTENGIKNNSKLWLAVQKSGIDLVDTLSALSVRASNTRPDNLPKFLIGSLKAILKDQGIEV